MGCPANRRSRLASKSTRILEVVLKGSKGVPGQGQAWQSFGALEVVSSFPCSLQDRSRRKASAKHKNAWRRLEALGKGRHWPNSVHRTSDAQILLIQYTLYQLRKTREKPTKATNQKATHTDTQQQAAKTSLPKAW